MKNRRPRKGKRDSLFRRVMGPKLVNAEVQAEFSRDGIELEGTVPLSLQEVIRENMI